MRKQQSGNRTNQNLAKEQEQKDKGQREKEQQQGMYPRLNFKESQNGIPYTIGHEHKNAMGTAADVSDNRIQKEITNKSNTNNEHNHGNKEGNQWQTNQSNGGVDKVQTRYHRDFTKISSNNNKQGLPQKSNLQPPHQRMP